MLAEGPSTWVLKLENFTDNSIIVNKYEYFNITGDRASIDYGEEGTELVYDDSLAGFDTEVALENVIVSIDAKRTNGTRLNLLPKDEEDYPESNTPSAIFIRSAVSQDYIDLPGGMLPLYVVDSNGVNYTEVVWSTNDPSIATVDQGGMVTAVGNGTVRITATSTEDGYLFATMDIPVSNQDNGDTDVITYFSLVDPWNNTPTVLDESSVHANVGVSQEYFDSNNIGDVKLHLYDEYGAELAVYTLGSHGYGGLNVLNFNIESSFKLFTTLRTVKVKLYVDSEVKYEETFTIEQLGLSIP
jgi:hypothetical protein